MNLSEMEFMNYLICTICDYATINEYEVTETLKIVSNNIISITEIANFDNWAVTEEKEAESEKQIPKKPNNIRSHVDHKSGECSICGTRLAHFGDMNYCHKCGNKLDWEDSEDAKQ